MQKICAADIGRMGDTAWTLSRAGTLALRVSVAIVLVAPPPAISAVFDKTVYLIDDFDGPTALQSWRFDSIPESPPASGALALGPDIASMERCLRTGSHAARRVVAAPMPQRVGGRHPHRRRSVIRHCPYGFGTRVTSGLLCKGQQRPNAAVSHQGYDRAPQSRRLAIRRFTVVG